MPHQNRKPQPQINKPLITYTEAQLLEQAKVIKQVLETGSPDDVWKLDKVSGDPKLHPQIKELIIQCRREVRAKSKGNTTFDECQAKLKR